MGVVTHFSITRCLHQTHDKGFALLESVKDKDVSYFYRQTETEAYLESIQTFKMDLLAKIVNIFQPSIIFGRRSMLDVWLSSEYVSAQYSNCFYHTSTS